MARRFNSRGRGTRRAPLRKFVWARVTGNLVQPDTRGTDLLDAFQTEYGAQLLGATVMRIRGYLIPDLPSDPVPGIVTGVTGIIVEQDQELADQALENVPRARAHDDWLAWLPFLVDSTNGGVAPPGTASWNADASPWAVDIKSSRKIEELGQGLHMWYDTVAPGSVTVNMNYDLSIGLKLP